MTRWWSSDGEQWAICSKNHNVRAEVYQRVTALTSAFMTCRLYGIRRILRVSHASKASSRSQKSSTAFYSIFWHDRRTICDHSIVVTVLQVMVTSRRWPLGDGWWSLSTPWLAYRWCCSAWRWSVRPWPTCSVSSTSSCAAVDCAHVEHSDAVVSASQPNADVARWRRSNPTSRGPRRRGPSCVKNRWASVVSNRLSSTTTTMSLTTRLTRLTCRGVRDVNL